MARLDRSLLLIAALGASSCTGDPESVASSSSSAASGSSAASVSSGTGGASTSTTGSSSGAATTGTAGSGGADPGTDPFGVEKIYPTLPGGREWYLPADATADDDEWRADGDVAATAEAGVFHVEGSPRVDVISPAGKAWWQNVEMTGYLRYVESLPNNNGQEPHFTWYARGERHTSQATAAPADINLGVSAPPGTETWPGYPFDGIAAVNAHCLGTGYKGAIYPDGTIWWKKEISHSGGYTARQGEVSAPGGMPQGAFIGHKIVMRNAPASGTVHVETWIDAGATGRWTLATSTDDDGWPSGSAAIDGCDAAPFGYTSDQIVTWAGPNAAFRWDNISADIKWLSVREIAPL